MPRKLETGPAIEPLTVAEAKLHLRIPYEERADDEYIGVLITAAREYAEQVLCRQLINATWRLYLDRFPGLDGVIRIPLPPLQSISSVKYVDGAGDEQTLDAAEYSVDTASVPGRIYPAYGYSWPSTRDQRNAVTITFVAGYGSAATAVPEPIRKALKLLIAHWYENREVVGDRTAKMPLSVDALLGIYRIKEFV